MDEAVKAAKRQQIEAKQKEREALSKKARVGAAAGTAAVPAVAAVTPTSSVATVPVSAPAPATAPAAVMDEVVKAAKRPRIETKQPVDVDVLDVFAAELGLMEPSCTSAAAAAASVDEDDLAEFAAEFGLTPTPAPGPVSDSVDFDKELRELGVL